MSITIAQVRSDLLSKLGIEDASTATSLQDQDVVVAINGAMQILQTAGEDFFTRQQLTVGIAAGTALYPISQAVQTVLGPIRLNGTKPLRALTSRGQLDQYARIFAGGTAYGGGSGEPSAYWVENLRSGTTGDINQINIWLAPVPIATGTLQIEVVDDAPAYTAADFSPGTLVLPIAQNYTESIFLPIARYLVMRSSQFSRPELGEKFEADYQQAMARLGLDGGFPNKAQTDPDRKVDA